MKLHYLGDEASCYLLNFKDAWILFDCGLELQSLLSLSPLSTVTTRLSRSAVSTPTDHTISPVVFLKDYDRVKVQVPKLLTSQISFDISQIDVVLLSNALNMLALPFITSNPLFRGKIYATEPTIQIGRKFMEEFISFVKHGQHQELHSHDQKRHQDKLLMKDERYSELWERYEKDWRAPYDEEAIKQCAQRITCLSYSESASVYGTFRVTPVSSGYNLGSSNWILETEFEKVIFLSSSSTATARHPEPLEFRELRNADVCILTDMNRQERVGGKSLQTQLERSVLYHPLVTIVDSDSAESMLNELCSHIGMVVGGGGDVLIPCFASGIVYDLIDYIRSYLNSINLQSTNLFFVSPVADHSLAYSNISAEWLCAPKQDRAFIAEAPFLHQGMVKTKQLYVFEAVNQAFAQTFHANRASPCVIFAGHPSLRVGDVLHLIKILSPNPKNALISIDCDIGQFDQLVAPFLFSSTDVPNKMRWIHCPIDLRLKRSEVTHLLKEIAPQQLVAPMAVITRLDMKVISNMIAKVHTLDNSKPIYIKNMNQRRKFEQAYITMNLASETYPRQIKGCRVARVTASLKAKDGDYRLAKRFKTIKEEEEAPSLNNLSNTLFGDQVGVDQIVKTLQSEGYEVKVSPVQDRFGSFRIDIAMINCCVTFSSEQTHVEAPNNELRSHLKQVLMKNYLVL